MTLEQLVEKREELSFTLLSEELDAADYDLAVSELEEIEREIERLERESGKES